MFRLLLLLIVIVIGSYSYATQGNEEITEQELLSLLPNDRFCGNINAPVIMIVYMSFTCYYCSVFYKEIFPQIKRRYIDAGKLLFVLRHSVEDHYALRATMLGHCYTNQEDYFKFTNAVFESMGLWNYSRRPDLTMLENIAKLSNMKKDVYDQCISMDNTVIIDKITNDTYLAKTKLGVRATPWVFIKINDDSYITPQECQHTGYNKPEYFFKLIDSIYEQQKNQKNRSEIGK